MTWKLEGLSGATARWENEGGHSGSPSNPSSDGLQLELQQYGIVPVPLMVFDWGGYRYSNARDAIAAAMRLAG
jgi:hypothetical protein